jgi:hypothetical protein
MRGLTIFAMLCASSSVQATDWTRTCDVVSHFAELVSVARDERQPAGRATLRAQQLLNHPDVLVPDVANEITRQIYETPERTPDEEAASFRTRCLTPVWANTNVVQPTIGTLIPIKLSIGVNHIATPEGGFDLTLSWKDDGNGRGHDVFTATVPGVGAILMPDGHAIADDPADDQDMRRSVRFARGQLGGEDAVVLLIAQRDPGRGATRTTYRMYRLMHDPEGFRFVLLTEAQLPSRYCNADAALSVASGLMLRESYRGARTMDGCSATFHPTDLARSGVDFNR